MEQIFNTHTGCVCLSYLLLWDMNLLSPLRPEHSQNPRTFPGTEECLSFR